MVKYIISWVILMSHEVECPSYKPGDEWHCAVLHMRLEEKKMSETFEDRKTAFEFFASKEKECKTQNELEVGVIKLPFRLGGTISNLKIDSVTSK